MEEREGMGAYSGLDKLCDYSLLSIAFAATSHQFAQVNADLAPNSAKSASHARQS